ncbi:MAG: hypothetical protein H7Y17_13135 [Chlorobia bacterium]|nr:hypothetical protein [Fimbriimonadaceae bacterium]
MRNDNYPSASEMVRNLSGIRVKWDVLHKDKKFRVVQFQPPFFDGVEFWVVNEKGFLWEPIHSLEAGLEYLAGDEAHEYQEKTP